MEPLQAATRTDHSETGNFYRLNGGREEIKMMPSIAQRPQKLSDAKSHKPFDQFAIARPALLLCSSRSPKSCSFHVEKVIVFSLCFWLFAFIMSSSSILGDCTLEQLPGKCSPLLHCTTTMLACSACCLRCWQLYQADVEAKKAVVEAKKKNGGINKG